MAVKITSPANPHVKNAVKLRGSHHRKKTGRMIVEGERCISRALAACVPVEELFYCREMLGGQEWQGLVGRVAASGGQVFDVTPAVMGKMAYRDSPEGLLAIAPAPTCTLDDLPTGPEALLIVAENLEKPGNLGAILRSADAAGATGMILCGKRTDVYNPNAIRSSTGTVFSVPVAAASADQTIAWLRRNRIRILAATPAGEQVYTAADLTGPVALVVGSEHLGLSQTLLNQANARIRIPMKGAADSLNAAATATILLFEAARRRAGGND